MNHRIVERSLLGIACCTAIASCTPDESRTSGGFGALSVMTGNTECADLIAGQTIDAGDVCVSLTDTDIVVTITTGDGFGIDEAHVWAGTDLADMPQTMNGNPIPGQFPYVSGDLDGANSWSVTIPLSVLDFACPTDDLSAYLAVHAAVSRPDGDGGVQHETGWGDGNPIVTRGNWAMVMPLDLVCRDCSDGSCDPGEVACETAFAFGDTCFIDIEGLAPNRWGWSLGPIDPSGGPYSNSIYAGAGQCDVARGTEVGSLEIAFSQDDQGCVVAHVTYALSADFTLAETHLYVGSTLVPIGQNGSPTVAPGLYPYSDVTNDAASTSYDVTLCGDAPIYVIAHAVTCGESLAGE